MLLRGETSIPDCKLHMSHGKEDLLLFLSLAGWFVKCQCVDLVLAIRLYSYNADFGVQALPPMRYIMLTFRSSIPIS